MSPPVAVIDALASLLDAEHNSMFRFLGENSPYVGRAVAEVRPRVRGMIDASTRNARALADAIESLGGHPDPRRLPGEEQYLGYLSMKFLLPKLVDEKQLLIRRYENALKLGAPLPPEVREMLHRHLAEHKKDLMTLESLQSR